MKKCVCIFFLIIVTIPSDILHGQYKIQKYVFSNGSSYLTNEDYKLVNTLGEALAGKTLDQSNSCFIGFWNSVISTVGIDDLENFPAKFELFQNYPNPFNPSTTIRYAISNKDLVILKIYDILGNEITTLIDEEKNPGIYSIGFSAADYQLSSGIYFYRLISGKFIDTKKIILLK